MDNLEQALNVLILKSAKVKDLEKTFEHVTREWQKLMGTEKYKSLYLKLSNDRMNSLNELTKAKRNLKKEKAKFWNDFGIYCDPVWQNYWGL